MISMEKNWAELPKDLVLQIVKRLCITNIYSFKGVCKPWCSAVQEEADISMLCPVPSPPWLTITPQASSSSSSSSSEAKNVDSSSSSPASFFNVTNKHIYFIEHKKKRGWVPPPIEEALCVGSGHGWLAYIDFMCVVYLTNPFKPDYESSVIKLPSIETLPCILGIERASSSCIDFTYWNAGDNSTYTAPSTRTYLAFVIKLVMSSPPSDKDKDPCTVMIIYGELNDIAFCKLGDTSWTPLDRRIKYYSDLYYSSNDQRFYAICEITWSVEVWDLRDSSSPMSTLIELLPVDSTRVQPPLLTPMERRLRTQCTQRKMYLVELHGDLLLAVKYTGKATPDGQVFNFLYDNNYYEDEDDEEEDNGDDDDYDENEEDGDYNDEDEVEENRGGISLLDDYGIDLGSIPYKTFCFDVYKLNSVKKKWVLVNCLGDGDDVLFLGVNNALAFSGCDTQELRGNSIYFTDDYNQITYLLGSYSFGGHDLGFFRFEDNSIHPCYYSGVTKKITPPPVWISPCP